MTGKQVSGDAAVNDIFKESKAYEKVLSGHHKQRQKHILYSIVLHSLAFMFSFSYFTILPLVEGHPVLAHNICGAEQLVATTLYLDSLYFSITTQTTVGYGDIVAVTRGAKICSIVQSVFGYFYLAFSIAMFACKGIMKSTRFELLLRGYDRDVTGANEYIANN